MKNIIKWIGLSICGLFIILGIIGLIIGSKDSLFMLMLGLFLPIIYFGVKKVDQIITTGGIHGKIIFGILMLALILGRIIIWVLK